MKYDTPDQNIDSSLKEWTDKITETVWLLKCWRALDYTGHFIDVHPEMRERIDEVSKRTRKLLSEDWGYKDIS